VWCISQVGGGGGAGALGGAGRVHLSSYRLKRGEFEGGVSEGVLGIVLELKRGVKGSALGGGGGRVFFKKWGEWFCSSFISRDRGGVGCWQTEISAFSSERLRDLALDLIDG